MEDKMLSDCCEARIETEYYEDEGAIIHFCKECGEYCDIHSESSLNNGGTK